MATYWEITAHSAYDLFSLDKYLIVNLVFFHLGFWSVNFFLIAPFPDHCLLVPFHVLDAGCGMGNYAKALIKFDEFDLRSHCQISVKIY